MTAIHRLTQANYGVHFADQTALVATPLVAALAFGSGPETIGLLVAAQSSAHLLADIPQVTCRLTSRSPDCAS